MRRERIKAKADVAARKLHMQCNLSPISTSLCHSFMTFIAFKQHNIFHDSYPPHLLLISIFFYLPLHCLVVPQMAFDNSCFKRHCTNLTLHLHTCQFTHHRVSYSACEQNTASWKTITFTGRLDLIKMLLYYGNGRTMFLELNLGTKSQDISVSLTLTFTVLS